MSGLSNELLGADASGYLCFVAVVPPNDAHNSNLIGSYDFDNVIDHFVESALIEDCCFDK